jgi:hypothetical protein
MMYVRPNFMNMGEWVTNFTLQNILQCYKGFDDARKLHAQNVTVCFDIIFPQQTLWFYGQIVECKPWISVCGGFWAY